MEPDHDLMVSLYDHVPFLGLPITVLGLQGMKVAVRCLLELGLLERMMPDGFLEEPYTGTSSNTRHSCPAALLHAWVQLDWHPYRVGRYLYLSSPELTAEILVLYLQIIAYAPTRLRNKLIRIITGKRKKGFLSVWDMGELLEVSERHRYAKSRKYLKHCASCRCLENPTANLKNAFKISKTGARGSPEEAAHAEWMAKQAEENPDD